MKKVAILQSNYLPWKGYFDIINMADEFIVYDQAQYTKNDWRNRNKIKTQNGLLWLTIPIRKKRLKTKICDTVAASPIWRIKHWKSICQWYSKSKYFDTYRAVFEDLYLSSEEDNLSQINLNFIKVINEILRIDTKITMSPDCNFVNGKTEKLVHLCKDAGATDYLSGPAAKEYLDLNEFSENGIRVRFLNYDGYTLYNQRFPPFEHKVSIVDLIFNEGPLASKYMKSFSEIG